MQLVSQTPDLVVPAARRDVVDDGLLDRTLNLTRVSGYGIAWAVIILVAAGLRLAHLSRFSLSIPESRLAFEGWSLYSGTPLDPGTHLPTTSPLVLLMEALSFFLFGTGDVSARIVPVIAGLTLLPLIAMLRPLVGRSSVIGMAALVAISPTIVYTSRLVDSNIFLTLSAMVIVVAFARAAVSFSIGSNVTRWALMAGIGFGMLLASGPASISVLIGLAVGAIVATMLDAHRATETIDAAGRKTTSESSAINAVAVGIRTVFGTPQNLSVMITGFIVTVIVLFTRIFSDLNAIRGLGHVFIDWGKLIGSGATAIPTQFYVLVVLLYELLAVIFAVVAITMPRDIAEATPGTPRRPVLEWPFFLGWFVATLIIFAFSSGRAADDSIQVVFPLVLMGGLGVGRLIDTIDVRTFTRGGFLLLVSALGIFAGLVAAGVLVSKSRQPGNASGASVLQALIVFVIVVGGMLYLGYGVRQGLLRQGLPVQLGRMVLLAVIVIIGAITFRSTTELNYYNIGNGSELLAPDTPTDAVPALVNRLRVLSRDVSVNRSDISDPLGTHSLALQIDPSVEWPFRWYFRDYTHLTIGSAADASANSAEVVIAPANTSLDATGYTPQTYTYQNRVPAAYEHPSLGKILKSIFIPSNWDTATQFLFFRQLHDPSVPSSIVVGYNSSLSTRLFPTSSATNLFAQTGAGSGDGQLNQPRGIALSPDGQTIYVVDSNNARIERYSPDGTYLGSWGGTGSTSNLSLGLFQPAENATFGAGDLVVANNGNVYVADTWNHVVDVIGSDGQVIRRIGQPGTATDNGDEPASVQQNPGLFFGPRAVAVTNSEIFVTDTGNERVQVFGLDGTFHRTWGGFGSAPNQLIEPVGIAVGANGNAYVADSGNARISVFTTDGTPVAQWPVPQWESSKYDPSTGARPNFEPYMTVAPNGYIYVTSRVSSSVLVFSPSGQELAELTSIGGNQLTGPVGIAISPDGQLYVTEPDTPAVYRETLPQINPETGQTGATPEPSQSGTPQAEQSGIQINQLPGNDSGATPESGTPAGTPELISPASPGAGG